MRRCGRKYSTLKGRILTQTEKVTAELFKLMGQSEKGFEVNTLKNMHIFKKKKTHKKPQNRREHFPQKLNSRYRCSNCGINFSRISNAPPHLSFLFFFFPEKDLFTQMGTCYIHCAFLLLSLALKYYHTNVPT